MRKQIRSLKLQAGFVLAPFVWAGFGLYFYGLWEIAKDAL